MGEIAARGGNSAAGLEKLVAGDALESEFCRGEYIRIAFMEKSSPAGETAFRESIDLAEERIDRRWPRAREWLPLHL